MAPLPVEQTGESSAATDSQRSIPTPFLTKTYQLVDDPAVDDLISWNEDGMSFVVWRPAEFARDLLPKHFKHNNFSSFVRQLNTYVSSSSSSSSSLFFFCPLSLFYCFIFLEAKQVNMWFSLYLQGFRKVVPDRWEFANDCFRRGERNLLWDIQRRKIMPAATATAAAAANTVTVAAVPAAAAAAAATAIVVSPANSGEEQVLSSNSSLIAAHNSSNARVHRTTSCTSAPELLEENERLRKENTQLSHELSQLKGLCNKILALMTNYTSSQVESSTANATATTSAVPEGKPLELLTTAAPEEAEVPHKLFGVSIGVKRCRREGESEAEKEELQNQTQSSEEPCRGSDVKSEPLDGNNSDDRAPWLELGKY